MIDAYTVSLFRSDCHTNI